MSVETIRRMFVVYADGAIRDRIWRRWAAYRADLLVSDVPFRSEL
jgi:hypothetical protein